MTNFEQFETTEDQAYWWVAKLTSGQVSAHDRQRFISWCEENPANHPAFLSAQALWIDMGESMANMDSPTHTDFNTTRQLDSLNEGGAINSDQASDDLDFKPVIIDRSKSYRFRNLTTSLCLLVASVAFVLNYNSTPSLVDQWQADFVTLSGQQSVFELADGSKLEINTASALNQHNLRSLELMEGEIFLTVESDPSNPFVVNTPYGTVIAVGTEFLVKQVNDQLTVAVIEGQVRVEQADKKIELADNQQLTVTQTGFSQPAELASNQLAWREQKIIFHETPLVEVIAELNRYLPGKVVLLDEGLENTPINAVFNLENADTALQVLEQNLPIQLSYVTTYLALVY